MPWCQKSAMGVSSRVVRCLEVICNVPLLLFVVIQRIKIVGSCEVC